MTPAFEVTFDDMRRDGVFAELARLFPDEASTRQLLEDVGVPQGRLRPFGQLAQELYWREASRKISDGAFAHVGLPDLLAAALTQWPGNASLRRLCGQLDHEDWPAADSAEVRVLCLAACPADQNRLRLAAEHRSIVMAVRHSPRPVVPILHPATRLDDITARLLDARPHIVHFGGHGDENGSLCFESDRGLRAPVHIQALVPLLKAIGGLRGIVLASCFSGRYAAELLAACDCVVGSPEPLGDDCAIAFSSNFYRALGEGLSIRKSFEVATAAMGVVGCPPHDLRFEPVIG